MKGCVHSHGFSNVKVSAKDPMSCTFITWVLVNKRLLRKIGKLILNILQFKAKRDCFFFTPHQHVMKIPSQVSELSVMYVW